MGSPPHTLSAISVRTHGTDGLSGIQLAFSDGVESPWAAAATSDPHSVQTVPVTNGGNIRFISMLVYFGSDFEGVRLLDAARAPLAEFVWTPNPRGTWSDEQAVPEGYVVAGVEANA